MSRQRASPLSFGDMLARGTHKSVITNPGSPSLRLGEGVRQCGTGSAPSPPGLDKSARVPFAPTQQTRVHQRNNPRHKLWRAPMMAVDRDAVAGTEEEKVGWLD